MAVTQKELKKYLNNLLNIYEFSDYGPNGLQVEGKEQIEKIAFSVSATRESVQKACDWSADALIVHHGLFWKFHGPRTITGSFAKRVKPLIENQINLFGFHLPLDAHLEFGNAASIAYQIGLSSLEPFGDHKGSPTGVKGKFSSPIKAIELKDKLNQLLGTETKMASHDANASISSMGIITGGANNDWVYCVKEGLDAYLTGEMSEHNYHEAIEDEVHFFAGGHHATEKFGVLSLKQHLEDKFEIKTEFFDSDNPA